MWDLAHFIGVTRPGHDLSDTGPAARPGLAAGGAGDGDLVDRLPRPGRAGEPVWYLVPDGVVQYIGKHGLYRGDGSGRAHRHPGVRGWTT